MVERWLKKAARLIGAALLVLVAIGLCLHFMLVRPAATQAASSPEGAFLVDVALIACEEVDAIAPLEERWEALQTFAERVQGEGEACARSIADAARCVAREDASSIVRSLATVREHIKTIDDTQELLARVNRRVAALRPADPETKRLAKALRGVTAELADIDELELLFGRERLEARIERKLEKLEEVAEPWVDRWIERNPELGTIAAMPAKLRNLLLLDLLWTDSVQWKMNEAARKADSDCFESLGLVRTAHDAA